MGGGAGAGHAWEGDRRADELAGQGAEEHAVPAEEVERAQWAVDATKRTQSWMAEALQLAAGLDPPRLRRRRQGRRAGAKAQRPLGGCGGTAARC